MTVVKTAGAPNEVAGYTSDDSCATMVQLLKITGADSRIGSMYCGSGGGSAARGMPAGMPFADRDSWERCSSSGSNLRSATELYSD